MSTTSIGSTANHPQPHSHADPHADHDAGLSMVPTRQVMDHEYDGIQEYDNPTPGWWHLIFLASTLFAFPYIIYYETNSDVPSVTDSYEQDKAEHLNREFALLGPLQMDEPTILRMMQDAKWMEKAGRLFATNCAQCHGALGQGLVGPNMTDDHYKNLKVLTDMTKVISNGAAQGAMPPWKGTLSDNNIVLVSAYMANLRGKNLPSTRPPEGDPIAPWPKPKQ